LVAQLQKETFEAQMEKGFAWIGTPAEVLEMAVDYHKKVGGFDIASAHVNPATTTLEAAERTMHVFAAGAVEKLAKI
jgi:hypothetical protein